VASTDDPGTCDVTGGAGNSVYAVKIWWDTDKSGSEKLNFEMAAKL
jgi:hypothetical protein